MPNPTPRNDSPAVFFALTFLLSVPFYILNAFAYLNVFGEPEIGALYIALFTVTPIASASILTFRRRGSPGLKELLGRMFDFQRIAKSQWYAAILLLAPLIFLLSLGVMVLSGAPIPPALTPAVALPAVFPFFVFMMPDPVVFIAQVLTLVGTRVLAAWIFNNTGKSVFAAIVFHAVDNTALVTLPEIKAIAPWGAVVHCGLVLVAAVVVSLLWGPRTLARYRFGN